MEELSNEEAHSLAANWIEKIKTNMGLSFPASTQGAHFSEQVQNGGDVMHQNKHEAEHRRYEPANTKYEDSVTFTQQAKVGQREEDYYGEEDRQPTLGGNDFSAGDVCKTTTMLNAPLKDNEMQKYITTMHANSKQNDIFPNTAEKLTFCNQRNKMLDSYDADIGFNDGYTKFQEKADSVSKDQGKENQNELFEIWDFNDSQRETAMHFLGKPEQHNVQNHFLGKKMEKNRNGILSFGKSKNLEEPVSIQDKSRKESQFNDVTSTLTSFDNQKLLEGKREGYFSYCKKAVEVFYKKCPVCSENNCATSNWCEECGKALISVEVKKCFDDSSLNNSRDKNHNSEFSEKISNADKESTTAPSFKLNPNCAEFVSAYAKPVERPNKEDKSNQVLSHSGSSRESDRQLCNSTEHAWGNNGSNPKHSNFDGRNASPNSEWSAVNFSPVIRPIFSENSFDMNCFMQNDSRGRSVSANSIDKGFRPALGNHPDMNDILLKTQKRHLASGASSSYDSKMDMMKAQNFYQRPRSISLLDFHNNTHASPIPFTHASPNSMLINYLPCDSREYHFRGIKHGNPVTGSQHEQELNNVPTNYQGFDFENPQFDHHLVEKHEFDQVNFSKEFVQTRLSQQVETVFGAPRLPLYHSSHMAQNHAYVPEGNVKNRNVDILREDPVRLYRKKKVFNNSMESPRSPRNILRKNKKDKARVRSGSGSSVRKSSQKQTTEGKPQKQWVEKNAIIEKEQSKNEQSDLLVPPLALEDVESYDQVLTMIRTAREEAIPYLCLPEEVILYILSFLQTPDLCRCARVCKQFYRISTDDSLWKEIILRKRHDLSDEIFGKIGQRRPISLTLSQCHSNEVTEEGLRDLFRNCGPTLQDLSFSACSGEVLVGELILLHASSRCKGLRSLDISWSNVSDIGIQAFAEAVERLECICMNGCQAITDEAVRCIAKKHSKSIRVIEMFGCFNISHVSLSILQTHCPNIETVNLGQCHKVTNFSVSELSKQTPKLENIDLRGCIQIRDSGVKELTNNSPLLSTLVIANCPLVTDESLFAISSHVPQLRCLDVCGCTNITDLGVMSLAKSCNKLEILDLSSTKATEKGVTSLANYSHHTLVSLKLSFCHNITENSLEQLVKKCKRLKLLHLYGCKSVKSLDRIQDLNSGLVIES